MQYLVGWIQSSKSYSGVLTPEQNAVVINGLIDRLQGRCNLGRQDYPGEWKIPTEPLPSAGLLGDLTEALIEKNKYLDEPDPENPGN